MNNQWLDEVKRRLQEESSQSSDIRFERLREQGIINDRWTMKQAARERLSGAPPNSMSDATFAVTDRNSARLPWYIVQSLSYWLSP